MLICLCKSLTQRIRPKLIVVSKTLYSSKAFEDSPIQASVTDDGKTIVAWHPEQKFPYEHSKPLPKLASKFVEEDSVLKLKLREEADSYLIPKDYTAEEVIRLTYSSLAELKHWHGNEKDHLKHPNPPIDRAGI